MNLSSRCKNIHIDNNEFLDKEEEEDEEEYEEDDDDDEEEMNDDFEEDEENADDVIDDEEEDDEPDFMDNSGKCWEFGCKIGDAKHLKEWCHKMGGMIVGKEEKLTRQFHCPNKECQFKAIFLKSCSIVYTRNKHNHRLESTRNNQRKKEEENTKPTSATLVRDYVDHYGKSWPFCAHIGKNNSQDIFRNKFGFSGFIKSNTTLNLYCRKRNPAGERCPFIGIYLMSNGCLYTRGEHEHSMRGVLLGAKVKGFEIKLQKAPQNIRDDYMDHVGKIWKFSKEIGKNVTSEIFQKKFGLGRIQKKVSGLNMQCVKKGPNGKCKFAGIYLNSNGCLYTRGKHEHAHIQKNFEPEVGDDYVDPLGKAWPFHAKIGKKILNDKLRSKFGFSSVQQKLKTLNLYCQKQATNGGKCPFSGIYLKSNECLYIRGKHDHKFN